jgi:5-methylcytosine-specific restriction endonuclease McrA
MSESKACNSCKQVKNLELFKKEKKSDSGYGPICARCHADKVAIYRKNNPDKVKASWKKTYDKNRSKRIANSQKWSANNPQQRKKIEAKYRANNRIAVQARSEAWRLLNPNKPRDYKLRRRARIQNNGQYLILAKEMAKIYSSPCFYCGGLDRIEADHIIPVSRGGRHSVGNLISACRWCNASKGNRFVSEWKREKCLTTTTSATPVT